MISNLADHDRVINIDNIVLKIKWAKYMEYCHCNKLSMYVNVLILLFMKEVNKKKHLLGRNLLMKPKTMGDIWWGKRREDSKQKGHQWPKT